MIKAFRSKFVNRAAFIFLFLLGVLILGVLIWYVDFREIVSALGRLSAWQIGVVLSFIFIVFLIAAWRWQIILRGYGYEIKQSKLFGLVFRSAAISLVFPSFEISGETFKAFRLRRHEISTPASFASVFFDFFMVLIANVVLGIGLLIYVFFRGPQDESMIWPIIGLLLAGASLFLILKKFFERGWFSKMIVESSPVVHYVDEKTLEDIKLFDFGISFFLKESKRYLFSGLFVSLLGFLWEMAQIFLGLYFLGQRPDFLTVAVFYLAINFFNSMPVFGGIGFGEAGAFLAGTSLGVPDSTSLALALILRVKQIEILVIGAWLFGKDGLFAFLKKGKY